MGKIEGPGFDELLALTAPKVFHLNENFKFRNCNFDLLFELIRDSSCLCIILLLGDSSLQDFVSWLSIDAVRVGGGFELDASSDSVVPQLKFSVTNPMFCRINSPNTEQVF